MLIEVSNLRKRYGKNLPYVIDGIDFSISEGQTLGIFGDSGSGKSTIGQITAGIYRPSAGTVRLDHRVLSGTYKGEDRRRIQILFQHPEVSFNPKMKIRESLKEPYRFYGMSFREDEFTAYLEQYGIYPEHLDRFPAELSGGELQRMALARVMLIKPDLLILDEPTSMLDVISQAQIAGILKQLQEERGTAYLFISHDIRLCELFCDKICYLENGKFC